MAGIWGDGQRGGIFGAKIPVITLTAAERDRYMQQRAEAAQKKQKGR